jgi:DNA polymerase II large subunit
MAAVVKFLVVCLECGRKFKTASMCPSCPKCGGSDVELA